LLTRRLGRSIICLGLVEAPWAVRLSYERGHVLAILAPCPRSSRMGRSQRSEDNVETGTRLPSALTLPAARKRRGRALYRTSANEYL
jgi:hypothetical protein